MICLIDVLPKIHDPLKKLPIKTKTAANYIFDESLIQCIVNLLDREFGIKGDLTKQIFDKTLIQ